MRSPPPDARRLLALVGAIVLVDTMFFAAITPLLPYYADRLDLSKTGAGVLAAAYPAGTVLGSLPGGWLAARAGVKPTVLLGLALLAVSSLAFGLADDLDMLVAARFVQGIGGAASWSGGLAWLVAAGPPERRGELLGSAFSAAIVGALLGPLLGAAARAAEPQVVFTAVALVAVVLAAWALREPAMPRSSPAAPGALAAHVRDRLLLAGLGVIVLVGLFFGVVEVLVPLRLDSLAAGGAVIGATFLAAAALQALASPAVGRLSDRRGALVPIRASLLCAGALALVLPVPDAAWVVAALAVVAGPVVGSLWVPGMAVVSHAATRVGLDQGYAFALVNLVWAAAQTAGAAGGAGVAEAGGDFLAYGALAAALGGAFAVAAAVRPAA